MTARRTLDVAGLPTNDVSSHDPLWWGQFIMALIEASMFFVLIGMYFYVRLSYDIWPPSGVQLPPLLWCTLGWFPLVLSAYGSYRASEAAKTNDRMGMIFGLSLNLSLGLLAMGMRGAGWWQWNFNWKTGSYGSIVWSLMWLHTLDAVADLVFTAVLIVLLVLGFTGPKQRIGVHVDSVLWYFIVLIWIPMYIVIFWGTPLRRSAAMRHELALWTGFLAGPLVWFLSFGARWSLSGWVCAFQWKPALFVIALVSLILAAGSGMLSWSEWQRVGREMPGEGGGAVPRARLMAIFGIVLSGLSILLIVSQAIPEIMLGACA